MNKKIYCKLLLFKRLTRGDVPFKFSPLRLKLLSGYQASLVVSTIVHSCGSFPSLSESTYSPAIYHTWHVVCT